MEGFKYCQTLYEHVKLTLQLLILFTELFWSYKILTRSLKSKADY